MPPVPQGELRWDLQVVLGVREWPEPLGSGWEWTLTLRLTKGSGPCRAEWEVFGHPGTLQEPENSKRPWTQNNHCNGYADCKAIKPRDFFVRGLSTGLFLALYHSIFKLFFPKIGCLRLFCGKPGAEFFYEPHPSQEGCATLSLTPASGTRQSIRAKYSEGLCCSGHPGTTGPLLSKPCTGRVTPRSTESHKSRSSQLQHYCLSPV